MQLETFLWEASLYVFILFFKKKCRFYIFKWISYYSKTIELCDIMFSLNAAVPYNLLSIFLFLNISALLL